MESKFFHNRLFVSIIASIGFVILGSAFSMYDLKSINHILKIPFDFIIFFILINGNSFLIEGIRRKLRKNVT
jgi:hypothetical protein